MPPELMPWHKTQLINPEYTRVDLVKEGANSQAHIKLFKNKGGQTMNFEELLAKMKSEHAELITAHIEKLKSDLAEEHNNALSVVEKAKKDAEEALEIAKSQSAVDGAQSEEEIVKSVKDPALRALLQTQIAKTKAAEDMVRKAAAEKLDADAIAKAKEVPVPGVEESQLADIYKSLNDKPEVRDNVFGILKSAAAVQGAGNIYEPVGKSATATDVNVGSSDAAWDQIEKAAAVHKSAGMTQAAAITKAINENPELYARYIAGQQ